MARVKVNKTYKLYIGGKFPRTESGRYLELRNNAGELMANVCQASKKDFREAVVAARKAQESWAGSTAYLKGQILYRLAEMMESRSENFIEELMREGNSKAAAKKELSESIDLLVYYAGWSDKYQQVFSAVNPVASSHFNFSVLEACGVVSASSSSLGEACKLVATSTIGGNSLILVSDLGSAMSAITLAEAIQASDFPAGVVNILTGLHDELIPHMCSHMDVNAVVLHQHKKEAQQLGAENVKRVHFWNLGMERSPYRIRDLQEVKTTWHPVEQISGSGSGY